MIYIYELRNQEGQIEYIGQSKNPYKRYYDHVHRQPREGMGHGYMFGRTDLELNIIAAAENRKDAHELEARWKIANNISVGEVSNRKFTTEEANEIKAQFNRGASIAGLARDNRVMRDTIRAIVYGITYRY